MSALFGCCDLAGRDINPDDIERMAAAMHARGPDGTQIWRNRHAALGLQVFRSTSDGREARGPVAHAPSGCIAVLDGRIDNAQELLRSFAGSGLDLRIGSDAELVLRSYEQWGDACVGHLVGEFAFAVWDPARRRLLAARDIAGTRTLHYRVHAGRLWFATKVQPLLTIPGLPHRLNREKILDYLAMQHDRDDVQSTFYDDVLALPQGHILAFEQARVQTRRYWHPEIVIPQEMSVDEARLGLLARIEDAVRCRTSDTGGLQLGSLLSGGLDSSTITAVARSLRPAERLTTISLVHPRADCPERQAVNAIAQQGGIDTYFVETSSASHQAGEFLDAIGTWDDPFVPAYGFSNWLAFRKAQEAGCQVLLEGMGGDLLFYSPTRSMQIALRRLDFRTTRDVLTAHRRHGQRVEQFSSLKRLAGVYAPRWAIQAAGAFRRPDRGYAVANHVETPGDNTRRMRRGAIDALLRRHQDRCRNMNDASGPAAHSGRWLDGTLSFAHAIEGTLAASMGIEERSPLSDRRVIEFAIQMPLEAKLCAGWYKRLLREATGGGLLPEAVRWRPDIGSHPGHHFTDALVDATLRQRPTLLSARRVLEALDPWLEPEAVRQSLSELEQSNNKVLRQNLLSLAILAEWLHTRF